VESWSVRIWVTAVVVATATLACNDGPTHPSDSTSSAGLSSTNLPPFVAAIESGCLSIADIPDPPADGGAFAVDIVASCPWTVTSDQPWLTTTARPTRWTGRDSIRYTVAPNVSGQTRVGGLSVTGGGNTVRLVVTQVSGTTATPCGYTVTPTTQPAAPSAGNYGFDLTTSCGW
jgi:Viral BACON domain